MGEGLIWVFVEERAGRDEVPADPLGVAGVEAAQRTANGGVQVADVGPVGQLRAGRQRGTLVLPISTRAARSLPSVPGRAGVLPRGAVAVRSTSALGTVVRGAPVLPLRPITTVTTVPRGAAVLPLRSIAALRTLTGGTTVLPLRSITGSLAASMRTLSGRAPVLPWRSIAPLRVFTAVGTVTSRTPVLPLRPITGSLAASLRTLSGRAPVLPLRPIASLRPFTGGSPVLPPRSLCRTPRGAFTPRCGGSVGTST